MVTTKARKATTKPEDEAASTEPRKRLFTIDEYLRMDEAGILGPEERTELIEGVILQIAALGSPHLKYLTRVTDWSYANRPANVLIRVHGAIRLSGRSLPQPDLAIVRYRSDEYGSDHPGPEDVLLVIEVSDTSLAYDLGIKRRRYALAGLPDYWVLATRREQLIVHREPKGGSYTQVTTIGRGQSVSPLAFPDMILPIDEIFA